MESDAASSSSPANASPANASPANASPADAQLPPGGSPFSRLADHAKGLSGDVRAWLELRYELARIELYERLDEQADRLVLYAIVGGLAAAGGLVALLSVCFLASWAFTALIGSTLMALFLGFLAVAVVFFFVPAALLFATKPRFGLFEKQTRATVAEERVMAGRAAGERVPADEARNA